MKVNKFWNYYIFHPGQAETKEKKIKYWASSVALGIISGGLVHLGCYCAKKIAKADHGSDSSSSDSLDEIGPVTLGVASNKIQGQAFSAINGTYQDVKPEVCCDYAFHDTSSGMIAVFDAAGHNSAAVHDEQVGKFQSYSEKLAGDIKSQKFKSIKEAEDFLMDQTKDLALEFVELQDAHLNSGTKYAGPALACGFVSKIGKKKHFVYAQVADCSICYRDKKGFHFLATLEDTGLGDGGGTKLNKHGHLPKVASFEIKSPCDIYVFSDGIGEFLTEKEFADVVDETDDPADLLENLKEEILSHGETEPDADRFRIAQKPGMKSPSLCKTHNYENAGNYDDLGLAHLRIVK